MLYYIKTIMANNYIKVTKLIYCVQLGIMITVSYISQMEPRIFSFVVNSNTEETYVSSVFELTTNETSINLGYRRS